MQDCLLILLYLKCWPKNLLIMTMLSLRNKNKTNFQEGHGIPLFLGVELRRCVCGIWILLTPLCCPPPPPSFWAPVTLSQAALDLHWAPLPRVTPACDRLVQKRCESRFPAVCQDALRGITPSPLIPLESGRNPPVRLRPLGLGFSLPVHLLDSTHVCDKPHTGTPELESASVSKFSFFREKC